MLTEHASSGAPPPAQTVSIGDHAWEMNGMSCLHGRLTDVLGMRGMAQQMSRQCNEDPVSSTVPCQPFRTTVFGFSWHCEATL